MPDTRSGRPRISAAVIDCAVVGASGYAGAELVSLLASHPRVNLAAICADSSAGRAWEELYPGRSHLFRGTVRPFDPEALAGMDVVFLALPHGASAKAALDLRRRVGTIIDLSGDLRLADADEYQKWYGQPHPAPDLLGQAAYGLPELFHESLTGADLIACAGCYATVSQLCAYPALGLEEIVSSSVVVSAISGTTGAGRSSDVALSFSEVSGNLRAYRVGRHQHTPEIRDGLMRKTGRPVQVTFVPHLAPIGRGIFATVVMQAKGAIRAGEILSVYREAYAGRTFVRIVDPSERLPQVTDVLGTNFCDIAPLVDESGGTIVVLGVIDNLGKGAAGQAVQVMNLALGLPEETGLLKENADTGASKNAGSITAAGKETDHAHSTVT